MPIVEINPRWYVEGIQNIYERENYIIDHGQPKRGIVDERRIDLTGVTEAPKL